MRHDAHPDMPTCPGLAERGIWLLPDLELCPENTGLYISMGFGFLSKFGVGGGRRNNRLDAVEGESEGVALLIRSDLDQGEGHRQGQGGEKDIDRDKKFDAFISFSYKDQDLVIQELIEGEFFARHSQLRYDRYEDSDRRERPGYQVVPSLQTLPPRRIHTKEHHEGRGVLLENSPRALSRVVPSEFNAAHVQALKDDVPRITVIKLADLPKDDDLPKEIQLYLNSTTYLTWGEKHFWCKLLYILPRSQSIQKPESRDDARFLIPMTDFSA
ncbi:protein toll [Caerostris extrusa]|uniref:Protein toll n=1 Tax=Caerostris extrusa TaxID=172846 RepID=A0AAV4YFW0_CAEEX|nr:protein toll [Caerostris extrusa]